MNPDNNNPSTNPLASGNNFAGNNPAMPNMGGMPMMDGLASAQDNLTAAGMAAGPVPGAMGLDQIAATDPSAATLPTVDEPLVPAAPVPGSIGSAVSMPAEPLPAPDFGAPAAGSGPMPAPEVAPAQPFNPFAAPTAEPNPAGAAPQANNPAGAQPAPSPAPASPLKPAAKTPLGAAGAAKKVVSLPIVILLGVLAAVLLVAAIVFFVLWDNASNEVKTVYVPSISEENSDATLTTLSCFRSETHESPSGTGTNEITLSYTGDNLSALTSDLTLNFSSADDANAMRDSEAANVEALASRVPNSLAVTANASDNVYSFLVATQEGTDLNAADAMNVIYGSTEGEPSLAIDDVQAKYENEGFVCER